MNSLMKLEQEKEKKRKSCLCADDVAGACAYADDAKHKKCQKCLCRDWTGIGRGNRQGYGG